MTRITKYQDQRARSHFAELEKRAKGPSPKKKASSRESDFSWMISGGRGNREIAGWSENRTEYVRHFKGTTFIAVAAAANRIATQEAKVFRKKTTKSGIKEEPVDHDHPLMALFSHVNPVHVQFDLWYQMVAWRLMTGSSYWWKAFNGFGEINELWPLPSQFVWAIPGNKKFIEQYLVRAVWGADTYLQEEEVLAVHEPSIDWSGNGRYYGTPRSKAGAEAVDLESAIFRRLYYQMKNFSPPGMHYSTDEEMGEEAFMEVLAQIHAQHSEAEQAGSPIVTHSGLKASEFRQSVREMDYGNSLDKVMDFILAIHHTPKAAVGLVGDVNRANLIGSLMAWCESTLNPLAVHLGQQLTRGLAHHYDEDLVVRIPPIEINDRESLRQDIETCLKADAATPNEIRQELLPHLPPLKDGDKTASQRNEEKERQAMEEQRKMAESGMTPSLTATEPTKGKSRPEDELKEALQVDSDGKPKAVAKGAAARFFFGEA